MENIYNVNGTGFGSFLMAVKFANLNDAKVVEVATGLTRWSPIPKKNKNVVRHVLVMADGSEKEFSKVRR